MQHCKFCYADTKCGLNYAANILMQINDSEQGEEKLHLSVGLGRNDINIWELDSLVHVPGKTYKGAVKIKYCPMCGRNLDAWEIAENT